MEPARSHAGKPAYPVCIVPACSGRAAFHFRPRLLPYMMIVHGLLDLQLVVMLLPLAV
jgi:hypothetical protein